MFTTRWVMSYLAGPLTRDHVSRLVGNDHRAVTPDTVTETSSVTADIPMDATTVAPVVANGVDVVWAAPSAPWVEEVGGAPGSSLFTPAAVARVHLLYDDHHAQIP